MNCYISRRYLAKFILLLISIFLIISCVKSTNLKVDAARVIISKNVNMQKANITIVPFMNSGIRSGYDSFISDKFAYALMGKGFTINIFNELQLDTSGMLSRSDLNKIRTNSNVDIICFGSVNYDRGFMWRPFPYIIAVRFVDVKSGDVVYLSECTNDKDWDGSNCLIEISNELSKVGK